MIKFLKLNFSLKIWKQFFHFREKLHLLKTFWRSRVLSITGSGPARELPADSFSTNQQFALVPNPLSLGSELAQAFQMQVRRDPVLFCTDVVDFPSQLTLVTWICQLYSMTSTSEKYERTQQGDLLALMLNQRSPKLYIQKSDLTICRRLTTIVVMQNSFSVPKRRGVISDFDSFLSDPSLIIGYPCH